MQGNGRATNSSGGSVYDALTRASVNRGLSFGQIDGDVLRECVARVTARGDAVLFGRTGDGGALTVHILTGGKAEKFYVSDASELMELLTGLIAALTPSS